MGKYVLPIPEDSISYCRIDPSSSPAKAMGVYLELDLEADPPAVSIEHAMQIDGIPMRVWHGRVRRYVLSPIIDAVEFATDVNNGAFDQLLDRIAAGVKIEWDGNNWVGLAMLDAENAAYELQERLDEYEEESMRSGEVGGIWDAGAWWTNIAIAAEDTGITDKTTDDELCRIAEEATRAARAENVVLYDPESYLRYVRDELRAKKEEEEEGNAQNS